MDLFAPAGDIVSTGAANSYQGCRLSGTSMAAPHVTGVIARYLEANSGASVQQVHNHLVGTATEGVLDPSWLPTGTPNRLLYAEPGSRFQCSPQPWMWVAFPSHAAIVGQPTEFFGAAAAASGIADLYFELDGEPMLFQDGPYYGVPVVESPQV